MYEVLLGTACQPSRQYHLEADPTLPLTDAAIEPVHCSEIERTLCSHDSTIDDAGKAAAITR